ncbi:MAG: nickel-dependent lactate racemase [Burkholderiales bacterium]|nr:nickel-dependent lactate racemase [Anaerolineae bacterium]
MQVKLAYGKSGLGLTLPDDADVSVIESQYVASVDDPVAALRDALQNSIDSPPLRELVSSGDTVAVVFSDITRPTPNHLILPAILQELDHIPVANIVLCNALGTHRPNTPEELSKMLGAELLQRYRIEQNDAADQSTQVYIGTTARGHEVWVNRVYMQADVKILSGFIEPHFFAGFSGGGKAAMPGMAGQQTVFGNHDAGMIGNSNSTWGVTAGNPIWEEAREAALMTNPAFLLNVSLNSDKQITGVFAGKLEAAHDAGIEFVRQTAMIPVDQLFDIVITTNSGYPLDMNLYQAVKGMSAAEGIVREGGAIIIASECLDGIPEHGLYGQLLRSASTPAALFDAILQAKETRQDQWQAQIQARIQQRADVYVYSDYLSDQQIREALLIPCRDIAATIAELRAKYGQNARIGILPDGPQTVAYHRERVAVR